MIAAVLFIIIIILIMYIRSINMQIKGMVHYLEHIKNDKTRTKLEVSLNNKNIENLAVKINEIIKNQESVDIKRRIQEEKLKSFIVSISHDLRTPLTSIRGYIQLIKSNTIPEGKKLEYLEIINNKSITLDKLINSFFELSLYDSDQYELNLDKIDITNITSNVLMDNYYNFKSKNISININIEPKPLFIIGDSVAFERIIQNLVSNAIKYAQKEVSINLCNDEKYCYLEISNKAIGLNDDDIYHIFDRFYRSDKSRSSKGTGIGLNIVKILCEKMNGEISAKIIDEDVLQIKISFPLMNI